MFTLNLSAGALFGIGVVVGIILSAVALVSVALIYSAKK